jgi:hypothetical protein
MTLHATHKDGKITVHTTYGPVRNEVTEDAGHVRGFHWQLTQLLAESEGVTPGQRLYNRYADFSDRKSLVSGDCLPLWADQDERIKAAWEHAAQ